MVTYNVASWIIWAVLIFILLFLGLLGYVLSLYVKRIFLDCVIFIDKNDRWTMHFTKLYGETLKMNEKIYYLQEKAGIVNRRGKALFIFSEGQPQPLHISYNKTNWLDSDSLMAVINNKLVQQIVKPTDSFKDNLILFGAIGGILAGMASLLILLIQLGVVNVK